MWVRVVVLVRFTRLRLFCFLPGKLLVTIVLECFVCILCGAFFQGSLKAMDWLKLKYETWGRCMLLCRFCRCRFVFAFWYVYVFLLFLRRVYFLLYLTESDVWPPWWVVLFACTLWECWWVLKRNLTLYLYMLLYIFVVKCIFLGVVQSVGEFHKEPQIACCFVCFAISIYMCWRVWQHWWVSLRRTLELCIEYSVVFFIMLHSLLHCFCISQVSQSESFTRCWWIS